MLRAVVLTQYRCVMDGQTDRQTEELVLSACNASVAACCNNGYGKLMLHDSQFEWIRLFILGESIRIDSFGNKSSAVAEMGDRGQWPQSRYVQVNMSWC